MAESFVLCPHCEQSVEIHAATVTRSRACPACGEVLVLQVAGKRKALLVAPTPPVDDTREESLTNSFAELPEDPFERMRLDPGLAAVRRKLFLGVAAVAGLIVLAIVADHLRESQPTASKAAPRPVAAVEPPRRIEHLQPVFSGAPLEERLGKLDPSTVLPGTGSSKGTDSGKEEKLAPPVFELSDAAPPLKQPETGAPQVFEVSDSTAIVAPRP